jgi:N-acetylglucosaminyldiphosphoundecaprenol N-acetyl-beta-D-mannosaminyltransferase
MTPGAPPRPPTVRVWGLPLVPWTRERTIEEIGRLIAEGRPSFFVTANLHFAMLAHERPELATASARAAFVLADGAPLVWESRRLGTPLPERVAGSDLIHDLAALAAERGYGIFFLGGAPGVADAAAANLVARHPGLRIAGTYSPPFRELSVDENRELIARIRAARPALLLTAFTMPRGELWLADHFEALGIPLCANIGAAIDFAAGRVRRAPRWMQRTGLEWAFRILTDPARLAPRYARNARFLLGMTLKSQRRRGGSPEEARR